MGLVPCRDCGKEISDKAISCPNCGCPLEVNQTLDRIRAALIAQRNSTEESSKQETNQKKNALKETELPGDLFILCVLAPIFGGIYWLVKHKQNPIRARKALTASSVPVGIVVLLGILIAILPSSSPSPTQSILPYSIEDEHSWSFGSNNFVEIRVVIQSEQAPSDQQLVDVAYDIYYSKWTGYDMVKIFVYAPGDDIEWISYATLEFRGGEIVAARVSDGPEPW